MGIFSWSKNDGPEGSQSERIKLYGLDRYTELPLATQAECADMVGRLAKGKLRWLNSATSEEKRLVINWARLISRDFEAALRDDDTEFYSVAQLPCPKEGVELALMLLAVLRAVERDEKGAAAAHTNYFLLASFVEVTDVVKPFATISDQQESVRYTMEIIEGWRELRQREQARLTTKAQDFMASK